MEAWVTPEATPGGDVKPTEATLSADEGSVLHPGCPRTHDLAEGAGQRPRPVRLTLDHVTGAYRRRQDECK